MEGSISTKLNLTEAGKVKQTFFMSFFASLTRPFVSFLRPASHPSVIVRKMATIINMPRDPNTLSNYNNWTTRHTKTEFTIDFKAQRLEGTVTLDLESITPSSSEEIILDSSYLDINEVSVNGVKTKDWAVKDRFEPYGSPLSIKIPGGKPKDEVVSIKISLSTTSKCTALQWLTPAQTKGRYPYMFSQCQAIHCRSLFPCQDTPDVKSTYEFLISSPLPVIASGVPVKESEVSLPRLREDGERISGQPLPSSEDDAGELKTYHFLQKIPMPSYLFALASGNIVTAPIGPRSKVATTPGKDLDDAKWELEKDTENFVKVAESLIFPYVWGEYNVLVLPASFPYGKVFLIFTVDNMCLIQEQVEWRTPYLLLLRQPLYQAIGKMLTLLLMS